MKLWGKVMRGFLLVMAAMFVVVTFIVPPETRLIMAVTAILLFAAGLWGVPALVKFFMSLTGDEELLANGIVASAAITTASPTGWRYNRYYPIVKFRLNVEPDGAAYSVDIKQAVDPELLAKLAPGAVVGVRVDRADPNRVLIDTREPIRGI